MTYFRNQNKLLMAIGMRQLANDFRKCLLLLDVNVAFTSRLVKTVFLCLSLAASLPGITVLAPCDRTIAEASLLKNFIAVKTLPFYPSSSIASKRTGIAVARICVAPNSQVVTTMEIVRAPDKAIGNSVKEAIRRWRFGPFFDMADSSHFYSYVSKVTFYFVEKNGKWLVLSPDQDFYIGPDFGRDEHQIPPLETNVRHSKTKE